jgi:hypothetical protein
MIPDTTPRPDSPDPAPQVGDDPGGAHAKGYTAEPGAPPTLPDPIPLADAAAGGIHVPGRDPGVEPTGRTEPPPRPSTPTEPVAGGH